LSGKKAPSAPDREEKILSPEERVIFAKADSLALDILAVSRIVFGHLLPGISKVALDPVSFLEL
jgi:hypothetical protein